MYVVNANPRQVMITIKVIKTSPPRPEWMGGWVAGGWVASALVMVSPDIIMSILTVSTELSSTGPCPSLFSRLIYGTLSM